MEGSSGESGDINPSSTPAVTVSNQIHPVGKLDKCYWILYISREANNKNFYLKMLVHNAKFFKHWTDQISCTTVHNLYVNDHSVNLLPQPLTP